MIFPFLDLNLINTITNTPIRRQLRPLIQLRVAGPSGRLVLLNALVDTGADEVLLPDTLLSVLGFAPGTGVSSGTSGIGGRGQIVYHTVRLELRASATDRLVWNTTIGFCAVPIQIGLFGVAGGLEFFHTTLNVIDRQVVLYPHHLMPLVPPSSTSHTPFQFP